MRAVEKRLRERVKELEEEVAKLEADRGKFRGYLERKLKWLIEIHGKGSSPSTAWFIEDIAKFFQTVERWYW